MCDTSARLCPIVSARARPAPSLVEPLRWPATLAAAHSAEPATPSAQRQSSARALGRNCGWRRAAAAAAARGNRRWVAAHRDVPRRLLVVRCSGLGRRNFSSCNVRPTATRPTLGSFLAVDHPKTRDAKTFSNHSSGSDRAHGLVATEENAGRSRAVVDTRPGKLVAKKFFTCKRVVSPDRET